MESFEKTPNEPDKVNEPSKETQNELTKNMRHKKVTLEAIASEIKELNNIIPTLETASPAEIKDAYLEYINRDESNLKEQIDMGYVDIPDPDDTEAIITYLKNELGELKKEQKKEAAETN
ncbi:MAG: hypothetical protein WD335_03860 [Candidatus Paceibacterota bacterium]